MRLSGAAGAGAALQECTRVQAQGYLPVADVPVAVQRSAVRVGHAVGPRWASSLPTGPAQGRLHLELNCEVQSVVRPWALSYLPRLAGIAATNVTPDTEGHCLRNLTTVQIESGVSTKISCTSLYQPLV